MSSVNGSKFNTPQFNTNDELGCGSSVPGAPTVKEQARSTIFCKDVTINGSLTIKTSCEIIPAAIDVGGTNFCSNSHTNNFWTSSRSRGLLRVKFN